MANSNSSLRGLSTVALSTTVLRVDGVKLATAASGIRYQGRDDVALIELAEAAETQCLYTTNKFCAAPVTVARRHHAITHPRYLVINAGNANAGTGIVGEQAAVEVCQAVASAANCAVEAVLPFSTGVIGEKLDAAALVECVPRLVRDLRADGWSNAAAAILTTDTVVKLRSAVAECGKFKFHVTGMTKGSGMIKPDMATMLAYVVTDAAVSSAALNRMLKSAADASFNRITVDGDTSTNDAFALIATGSAGNPMISDRHSEYYSAVYAAIELVSSELAKDIVRDGEGATKFVTVTVNGGKNTDDCRRVAYAVAESPLVKTAFLPVIPTGDEYSPRLVAPGQALWILTRCASISGLRPSSATDSRSRTMTNLRYNK